MKLTTKKNDGVSPVIGTILLVAITVVLVAIISAVVMGMTGDIGTSKVVGVQVTPNSTTSVFVTITGGANAGDLTNLSVYFGSTQLGAPTELVGSNVVVVGKPYTFTSASSVTGTISVVGIFKDGKNQSIYSGTISLA